MRKINERGGVRVALAYWSNWQSTGLPPAGATGGGESDRDHGEGGQGRFGNGGEDDGGGVVGEVEGEGELAGVVEPDAAALLAAGGPASCQDDVGNIAYVARGELEGLVDARDVE